MYTLYNLSIQPHQYCIVKRKTIEFSDGHQWVWGCSCNRHYLQYYDGMPYKSSDNYCGILLFIYLGYVIDSSKVFVLYQQNKKYCKLTKNHHCTKPVDCLPWNGKIKSYIFCQFLLQFLEQYRGGTYNVCDCPTTYMCQL